jgi:hypothetical protein
MELEEMGLYECDWVGYEKVIKRIDNDHTILIKHKGKKWVWYNHKDINPSIISILSYKYGLKTKHYKSFKTFIKKSTGEYGHIEYRGDYFQIIDFYTTSIPSLIHHTKTLEGLKQSYSECSLEYFIYNKDTENFDLVSFNWDEHFPEDWELVEVNLGYNI